jgi:ubiquinone/menaquinone biosynthesis C-methylase UbiE
VNNHPVSGSTLFDSLAVVYDAWFESEGKLIFKIETRAFQEILPLLPLPWLEVGVGSGRFARKLGIETGIDPSIKLLEIAKKRRIQTCLAAGERQPFKDNSIGTIFLIVTLCFLDFPLDVLREIYRVTKPGGQIVLGLVLRESTWGQYYLQKKLEGHRFYKYATFYSYEETESLLIDSGFKIDKVVSTLFQRPGEVVRTEKPENGLSAGAGFTIITAEKPAD